MLKFTKRLLVAVGSALTIGLLGMVALFGYWFGPRLYASLVSLTGFIDSESPYLPRPIPSEIIPLGLTLEELEKHRGLKHYRRVRPLTQRYSQYEYERVVRNNAGSCDIKYTVLATFNDAGRLTEAKGFTRTYPCWWEP